MGIPVHITLVVASSKGTDTALKKVEEIFNEFDARFSRFKETSELHKLNTSNGKWLAVSIPMFQMLKKCVTIALETNGAFDPSVGGILSAYGYGLPKNFTLPSPIPTYRDIEFNDRELSVRLAVDQILEPAGIVKGIAIDSAGKYLIERGISRFLINAGGDIVTHGEFEGGVAWNIGIQDPHNQDAIVATVAIQNAGMATSGTYRTGGLHNGAGWHHLIDMQTGKPTDGIISATVIASTCEEADMEATLAILLSEKEATERLEKRGLAYFLIHEDGRVSKSASLASIEIPVAPPLTK